MKSCKCLDAVVLANPPRTARLPTCRRRIQPFLQVEASQVAAAARRSRNSMPIICSSTCVKNIRPAAFLAGNMIPESGARGERVTRARLVRVATGQENQDKGSQAGPGPAECCGRGGTMIGKEIHAGSRASRRSSPPLRMQCETKESPQMHSELRTTCGRNANQPGPAAVDP